MLTLFLIGCTVIIVSGLHQYYKWQLSLYQAELSRLEERGGATFKNKWSLKELMPTGEL